MEYICFVLCEDGVCVMWRGILEYTTFTRSNIRIRGNIPVSLEATYEAVGYANTTRECTGEKRGD
jgi:hypothetical protein